MRGRIALDFGMVIGWLVFWGLEEVWAQGEKASSGARREQKTWNELLTRYNVCYLAMDERKSQKIWRLASRFIWRLGSKAYS